MEKTLFEQMGGTYTKVGDYYLPALTLPAEKEKHIGVWEQRHAKYLKQNHKVLYMNLLTSDRQGMTEQLKSKNQFLWIQKMNNSVSVISGSPIQT